MTGNSLSQDLAGWTLGLRYEDLPERVVADVKLRVLDTLGLIISGAGTPMGRAVYAASSGLGSGRRARLIPSGKRTSAPTAGMLARAGFTGPRTVLEGRFGLYRSFLRGSDHAFNFERVTSHLGHRWTQLDSSFKPYPCAHAIHSFVDAALVLRTSLGFDPDDIVRIEAKVAPHFVALICEPREQKLRPRISTHARASLQYAIATAFRAGSLGPEHYTEASIEDPEVLALAGRIACTLDPKPPPITQYRGVVTVETKDGRRETVEIPHNRGSRENPMREDEIVAKFEACARSLSSGQRRRIIDRVFALESAESVAEVVSACT